MPNSAKVLIATVMATSALAMGTGLWEAQRQTGWTSFFILLLAAIIASRFRVRLPRLTSTMSGNLPVILLAVLQLDLLKSCLVAAAAALAQSYVSRDKKPRVVQVLFSMCVLVNASALAYGALHEGLKQGGEGLTGLWLAVATGVYFLANTAPVAGIIGLTEGRNILYLWRQVFLWSFPNYVIGAGLSGIAASLTVLAAWRFVPILLAVLYGVHRSYRVYVAQTQSTPLRAMVAAEASR